MTIRHCIAIAVLFAFVGIWGVNASAAESQSASAKEIQVDDRLKPGEPMPLSCDPVACDDFCSTLTMNQCFGHCIIGNCFCIDPDTGRKCN